MELPPIIIDNGSGRVKAGFASDDYPCAVFPALVGRVKHASFLSRSGVHFADAYVGDQAQAKRGILSLSYPIEHGIVTNWENMQLVWEHTFENELRCDPAERPVFLTEAPFNPRFNREKMAELMFEYFETPGLFVGMQAVLSLYATGRLSGLVVDVGDGVTHTAPVYQGHLLRQSVKRMDLAGRDLTDYLRRLLMVERGLYLSTSAEKEIVRDMKEKCCYVADDLEEELEHDRVSGEVTEYQMPDGQIISLGSECFRTPEALFQPHLTGSEEQGLHQIAYSSIAHSDVSTRRELYSNIVLSGGSTNFDNLPERLQTEIQRLAPSSVSVRVLHPEDRQYSVWIGAATLASLESFLPQWVTKEEYEERGMAAVHAKCDIMS